MSKRNNRAVWAKLALHLAGGGTVAAFARETRQAERTVRRWSKQAEVLEQIEHIRRRSIDRAVGELSRGASAVARRMKKLAHGAESEGVQLAACRAVLSDLIQVSDHATVLKRIAELERRVDASQQSAPPA